MVLVPPPPPPPPAALTLNVVLLVKRELLASKRLRVVEPVAFRVKLKLCEPASRGVKV